MRFLGVLFLALAVFAAATHVNAQVLAGQTVNVTAYSPNLSTVYTQVGAYTFTGVAPTTFTGVIGQFNVAVTDKNILVTFNGPFSWTCCEAYNGWVLTVEGGAPISSVTVNPATTIGGFTLTFDASHIYVNWPGVQGDATSILSLDVNGSTAGKSQLWSSFAVAFVAPYTISTFTPDSNIKVTRIQAQLPVAPSHCHPNAVVSVSNGSSSVNLTLSTLANDSGPLSTNFAAGVPITLKVSTPASCLVGVSPVAANIIVQYAGAP